MPRVMAADRPGVQAGIAGADGQPALAAHRVARIDGQVEQCVFHIPGVGQRVPQVGGNHRVDLDAFAQRAAQHVVHATHQPAGIDHLRRQRLASAKGQQLRGQLGAALHTGLGLGHPLLGGGLAGHLVQQQLQVAADHLQQVVEVMRNAAGQVADGLHLLAVAQHLLHAQQLGAAFVHPLR